MSGLLRRIRRERSPAPEPAEPEEGTARPEEEPAHDPAAGEQPRGDVVLPAGTDLDALVGDRPSSQRRSRLRRRLRHLRRVREVLLRDLGGISFEIHRSGSDPTASGGLVERKLERLAAVDAELRELESILDDRRGRVLREPGIGGTCPLCGELYGSEARFCWACGTPVAPGAVRPVVSTGSHAALGPGTAAESVESWTSRPAEPQQPPAEPQEPPTAVIEGEAVPDDEEPAARAASEWEPPER